MPATVADRRAWASRAARPIGEPADPAAPRRPPGDPRDAGDRDRGRGQRPRHQQRAAVGGRRVERLLRRGRIQLAAQDRGEVRVVAGGVDRERRRGRPPVAARPGCAWAREVREAAGEALLEPERGMDADQRLAEDQRRVAHVGREGGVGRGVGARRSAAASSASR